MKGATILLVDDEDYILSGLRRGVEMAGMYVLCARNAEEALALLNEQHIDAIVCDEQMPGLVGSELMAYAYQRFPEVVRILLTGKHNLAAAHRAIEKGHIFKYLEKPCPGHKVLGAIEEGLLKRKISAIRGKGQVSMPPVEQRRVLESVAAKGRAH